MSFAGIPGATFPDLDSKYLQIFASNLEFSLVLYRLRIAHCTDTFPCVVCSSISGNVILQAQVDTLAELSGIKSTQCIYSKCMHASVGFCNFFVFYTYVCMYAFKCVSVSMFACMSV